LPHKNNPLLSIPLSRCTSGQAVIGLSIAIQTLAKISRVMPTLIAEEVITEGAADWIAKQCDDALAQIAKTVAAPQPKRKAGGAGR
jgi:hypothetical protein